MNTKLIEVCPVELPKPGAKVQIKCGDDTPHPHAETVSAAILRGWADFFRGVPNPETDPRYCEVSRGWHAAKGHKQVQEAYTWIFEGAEKGEDGWYAILSREEPRSYNDVMNGTGTGLGTVKVTEKVKIA